MKSKLLISVSIPAVLAAGLLTGCGGAGGGGASVTASAATGMSPSDEADAEAAATIRSHVNLFTAAFGSGDVETACRLFDPKTIKPAACENIYGGTGSPFTRSFLTAKIERVVVNGDTATVALSNDQILRMVNEGVVNGEGGYWEVKDLGGEENTTG